MNKNLALCIVVLALDRVLKMVSLYGIGSPDQVDFATHASGVVWGFVHYLHDGFLYNVHVPRLDIVFSVTLLLVVLSLTIKPLWQAVPERLARLGVGMIVVGLMSQVADFALYGGGIDYLLFSVGLDAGAVFNLADVAIGSGVAVLVVSLVKELKDAAP